MSKLVGRFRSLNNIGNTPVPPNVPPQPADVVQNRNENPEQKAVREQREAYIAANNKVRELARDKEFFHTEGKGVFSRRIGEHALNALDAMVGTRASSNEMMIRAAVKDIEENPQHSGLTEKEKLILENYIAFPENIKASRKDEYDAANAKRRANLMRSLTDGKMTHNLGLTKRRFTQNEAEIILDAVIKKQEYDALRHATVRGERFRKERELLDKHEAANGNKPKRAWTDTEVRAFNGELAEYNQELFQEYVEKEYQLLLDAEAQDLPPAAQGTLRKMFDATAGKAVDAWNWTGGIKVKGISLRLVIGIAAATGFGAMGGGAIGGGLAALRRTASALTGMAAADITAKTFDTLYSQEGLEKKAQKEYLNIRLDLKGNNSKELEKKYRERVKALNTAKKRRLVAKAVTVGLVGFLAGRGMNNHLLEATVPVSTHGTTSTENINQSHAKPPLEKVVAGKPVNEAAATAPHSTAVTTVTESKPTPEPTSAPTATQEKWHSSLDKSTGKSAVLRDTEATAPEEVPKTHAHEQVAQEENHGAPAVNNTDAHADETVKTVKPEAVAAAATKVTAENVQHNAPSHSAAAEQAAPFNDVLHQDQAPWKLLEKQMHSLLAKDPEAFKNWKGFKANMTPAEQEHFVLSHVARMSISQGLMNAHGETLEHFRAGATFHIDAEHPDNPLSIDRHGVAPIHTAVYQAEHAGTTETATSYGRPHTSEPLQEGRVIEPYDGPLEAEHLNTARGIDRFDEMISNRPHVTNHINHNTPPTEIHQNEPEVLHPRQMGALKAPDVTEHITPPTHHDAVTLNQPNFSSRWDTWFEKNLGISKLDSFRLDKGQIMNGLVNKTVHEILNSPTITGTANVPGFQGNFDVMNPLYAKLHNALASLPMNEHERSLSLKDFLDRRSTHVKYALDHNLDANHRMTYTQEVSTGITHDMTIMESVLHQTKIRSVLASVLRSNIDNDPQDPMGIKMLRSPARDLFNHIRSREIGDELIHARQSFMLGNVEVVPNEHQVNFIEAVRELEKDNHGLLDQIRSDARYSVADLLDEYGKEIARKYDLFEEQYPTQ